MKVLGDVLGLLGLGSLVLFVASGFWWQVCSDPTLIVIYFVVLAGALGVLWRQRHLSLEAAGMVLSGFALDVLILLPAILYRAPQEAGGSRFVPRPYADLVSGMTWIPVVLLVTLIVLSFVRYPNVRWATSIAAVGQLWTGFVCWIWALMSVTGNYL